MAIVLGNNPKTFKKVIHLFDVNGKKENLQIEFKYRTRQQFAALVDARNVREKAKEEADLAALAEAGEEGAAKTYEQTVQEMLDDSVAKVLEIAQGWDLEDEFTSENLMQLDGMFPSALMDIQNAYQAALLETRRKN